MNHRCSPIAVAIVALLCAPLAAGCGRSGPEASAAAATPVPALHSRTDLHPPRISISTRDSGLAQGLVFVAPKTVFGAKKVPGAQVGPMITDDRGRVRWFEPMPAHTDATDFRVQQYKGQPVLTFWKGHAVNGQGDGACVILDASYRQIASIGTDADLHECQITPQGTMLATAYVNVTRDLRAVGGKRHDSVVDGRVEEYDIATGHKVFEWSSLDHVDVRDSYQPIGQRYNGHWDYFHINSIDQDADGNLIVSSRHTWTVYKIDHKTGKIIWRLGGKKSTFAVPADVKFAWQHDARAQSTNVMRIFDNDAGSKKVRDRSRVITVALDPKAKTAKLVRAIEHPDRLSVGTQGDARVLANGDTFVGWGSQGRFSEFDATGKLRFDGRVPKGMDTYRAFRDEWTGTPSRAPQVSARADGDQTTVYASFNGSTEVQSWRVLAGSSAGALRPVTTASWNGLETTIHVKSAGPYLTVQALDRNGTVIATAAVTRRAT